MSLTNIFLSAGLFEAQWRRPLEDNKVLEPREYILPKDSKVFEEYYDQIQGTLKSLAGLDEFLTGLLSYECD